MTTLKEQTKSKVITVKYVNPPKGNGPASIKEDNNAPYYYFWTHSNYGEGIPFETFREGGTYAFLYTTKIREGREQYTIKPGTIQERTGQQLGAPTPDWNDDIPFGKPPLANTAGIVKQALTNHPVPPQGGADIGGVPYSPPAKASAKYVPDKDEHIHVSMVMKGAIRGGHCDPNSAADLVRVGRTARAAYPAIWKDDANV